MENGCPMPIDSEKNKKELVGAYSSAFVSSGILYGDGCASEDRYDLSKPSEKMAHDIIKEGKKIYVNPDTPPAEFTHNEWRPQLSADLNLIINTTKQQIKDAFDKAVVSGADYTIEQALEDAKAVWEQGGGKQVDEWYKNWYAENKDSWPMNKDLYMN
jgi:putative aldouronate transport system substrate-binding protein